MSELFLYSWMHSNSFRLQVLMSLLLSHLYACMRIIYMYDPPPNFDTNPRSKKKHKPLENTGQPHQTRVQRGGVPYIHIYIYTHAYCMIHAWCSFSMTPTLVDARRRRRRDFKFGPQARWTALPNSWISTAAASRRLDSVP